MNSTNIIIQWATVRGEPIGGHALSCVLYWMAVNYALQCCPLCKSSRELYLFRMFHHMYSEILNNNLKSSLLKNYEEHIIIHQTHL